MSRYLAMSKTGRKKYKNPRAYTTHAHQLGQATLYINMVVAALQYNVHEVYFSLQLLEISRGHLSEPTLGC